MFIGEADSLFPLYSVHGWECWLTRVCAPKEGHHFFAQVASKWETLLQTQLQKWPALCSTLKMSFSKCLQFYHFTFYSSTLSRAEQSDSWSERWHRHMEGVFQWSWKSPCAHSHPWIWIQIPPSALPKHSHILCGLSAPAEMVVCGDSSEFGEVNEFSVRYVTALITFSMLFGSLSLSWIFKLRVFRWPVISVITAVWSSMGLPALAPVFLCCPGKCKSQGKGSETVQALFHGTTISLHCASVNHHTPCHSPQWVVGTVCGSALWRLSLHEQLFASRFGIYYFSVLIPVTPDGWCSGNW